MMQVPLPACPFLRWSLGAGTTQQPNPGFISSWSKTSGVSHPFTCPVEDGPWIYLFIWEEKGLAACLMPLVPSMSPPGVQQQTHPLPAFLSPAANFPDVNILVQHGARLRWWRWRLQRKEGTWSPPGLTFGRHVSVCACVCGGEERCFPSPLWAFPWCSWGLFPPWPGDCFLPGRVPTRWGWPSAGPVPRWSVHAAPCWQAGIFSSPTALLWSFSHISAMAAGLNKIIIKLT